MLGYDVDFGHMEAVSLISAPKYPEKQVIFSSLVSFSYAYISLLKCNAKGVNAVIIVYYLVNNFYYILLKLILRCEPSNCSV